MSIDMTTTPPGVAAAFVAKRAELAPLFATLSAFGPFPTGDAHALAVEAEEIVARINARYEDADITASDLVLIDGVWTIDGMVPDEWAEAMYGDTECEHPAGVVGGVCPSCGIVEYDEPGDGAGAPLGDHRGMLTADERAEWNREANAVARTAHNERLITEAAERVLALTSTPDCDGADIDEFVARKVANR